MAPAASAWATTEHESKLPVATVVVVDATGTVVAGSALAVLLDEGATGAAVVLEDSPAAGALADDEPHAPRSTTASPVIVIPTTPRGCAIPAPLLIGRGVPRR
jgi:hypothetical protein